MDGGTLLASEGPDVQEVIHDTGSELLRAEIERVWDIHRSEVIDKVYYLENGTLVLRPQHHDVPGMAAGRS
jgi:hypothetical protein